jgi:hypothetical protein
MKAWAMRNDGTFVVELYTPLKYQNRDIDHIIIQAPRYEHSIRWNRGEIPSGFALLSELCNLPERLLRQVVNPDIDRITFALFAQAKFAQTDVFEGKIPLATPDEQLPEESSETKLGDQIDPRFPHFEGPIKRFPTPPVTQVPGIAPAPAPAPSPTPAAPSENFDLGLTGPDVMKAG